LGDAVTGVAGHVSNSLHRKLTLSSDSLSHFDPFGTEFCEPGRVDHPVISDLRLPIADLELPELPELRRSFSIGNWQLAFGNYKDPSNFFRSSWRPRASLDLTVPTLIPRVSAISS
jgi:hypothetical protein